MISKELLSKVLHTEVLEVRGLLKHENNKTTLSYSINDGVNGGKRIINIHELAFYTREYLIEFGFYLSLNDTIENIFNEANTLYERTINEA